MLTAQQKRAVVIGKANRTHGESMCTGNTAEYRVWAGMLRRCFNPNDQAFHNYGGRGITVCDRWRSYENFLVDMGRRPSDRHTLERRNNDGNYEPDNCYWDTYRKQARNRRNNRLITHEGITLCLAEWAERVGIKYSLLHERISKYNWPFDKAITTPNKRQLKRQET